MEGQNRNNLVFGGAIVLLVLVVIYGVFKYVKKDANTSINPVVVPIDTPVTYLYKDGIYSSFGNYISPGGEEQIDVSVTLKDDVITDVSVKSLATRPTSVKMQGIFIANYKPLVIGKKIDDVVLDKVSGSSLTPLGFNNALESIKNTAQI